MSKHTPGPWTWGHEFKGLYGAGPDNEVLYHAHFEGMWLNYRPSREADAALIAAAPELLAASIRAEDWISGFDDDNKADDIAGMLRDLRAAIAKATGEQP